MINKSPTFQAKKRLGKLALSATLILMVAGCGSIPSSGEGRSVFQAERSAQRLSKNGEHADSGRQYIDLAMRTENTERNRYLILAARELYLANDIPGAKNILAQAEATVTESNVALWGEVAAELSLATGQPARALRALDRIPADDPNGDQKRLLILRAEALFRLGRAREGVNTLIERDAYLRSSTNRAANQRLMWRGLQVAGANLKSSPDSGDPVADGWLEIGYLAYKRSTDLNRLRSDLSEWQQAHPNHPASRVLLAEVLESLSAMMNYPTQVALLLPLSGRQQPLAEAIRDGFMAAHFAMSNVPERPAVTVYDSQNSGPVEAYQQAVADGADFIVGPLLKDAVAAVSSISPRRTTLTLNFLPEQSSTRSGFYQYGLSPEDEARQVVRRAAASGFEKVLVLTPESEWGQRILQSFVSEVRKQQGTLLAAETYDPAGVDFSDPIRRLMLLDEAEARKQKLSAIINEKLEYEPRIRADADYIFIAANAAAAGLIKPQLRFHYAGNLPTFSTSAVYQPGSSSSQDLNGIMFPDLPWLLTPSAAGNEFKKTLTRSWGGNVEKRARFYAMGHDAYRLMPLLNSNAQILRTPVPGLTGGLYMDRQRKILRVLPWAQFQRGVPRALPEVPRLLQDNPDAALNSR